MVVRMIAPLDIFLSWNVSFLSDVRGAQQHTPCDIQNNIYLADSMVEIDFETCSLGNKEWWKSIRHQCKFDEK